MRKIILISVLMAIMSLSCSVSKRRKTEYGPSYESKTGSYALKEILKNNLSNGNFYIQRADVRLTQENVSVNFNASIKFRMPDSMLVSVKTKTGLEAGRALITGDTIIINDRINKTVIIDDAKSISRKYGIDPDYIFVLLGDLIINESETIRNIDCSKGMTLPRLQISNNKIEYTIDCSKGKIVKAFFEGDIRSGNIIINYSDFLSVGSTRFPERIEISDDLKNVSILIVIKKIDMQWEGPLKLVTGSGYKTVRIK